MVLRSILPWTASVAVVAIFLLAMAAPVFASSFTLTVHTNSPSYAGSQDVRISGDVSPLPGPNTAVIVSVTNPNGATVDVQDDAVNASGSYNGTTVSGGPIYCGGTPCWVTGTYVINATWGGDGASAVASATFTWSNATTTTASSSSSSSTSSASNTSTSTTMTTTVTTSSSTAHTNSTTTATNSSTSVTTTESSTTLTPIVVTATQSVLTASTTTFTSSGAQLVATSKGGSSTLTYGILAVVIIIVIATIGFAVWRRSDVKR
jgi:cobalamin biosynthesis Mg chelatase CobN